MAGESSLLSALLQDEGSYLNQSPFYNAGASVLRAPTPAPRNNTEAFLLPILQGLGGGLMAGYGQGQADKQMASDYQSTLAQILGNDTYQLPSDFSPQNARSTIANALLQKQQRDEAALERQKSDNELSKLLLGQGAMVDPNTGQLIAVPKLAEIQAAKEKAITNAKEGPTKIQGLEDTFYKRVTDLPSFKQFSDIDANFKTILSLKDNQSAPATVAMLTSFARLMDPGSSVREGEVATVGSNAQSWLDKVAGDWRLAFEGKSKLSQEAKNAMAEVAASKYNEFGKKYSGEKSQLVQALQSLGGDPAHIPTPDYSPYISPQAPGVFDNSTQTSMSDLQSKIAELKAQGVSKEQARQMLGF